MPGIFVKMNKRNYTFEPSQDESQAGFDMKYAVNGTLGWWPSLRQRYHYFTLDDLYEGLLNKLFK